MENNSDLEWLKEFQGFIQYSIGNKNRNTSTSFNDVYTKTDTNIDRQLGIIKWNCHLHPKGECFMITTKSEYHHVIPSKYIHPHTSKLFNTQVYDGDFSELIGTSDEPPYVSPLLYSNLRYNEDIFKMMILGFNRLDEYKLIYTEQSPKNKSSSSSGGSTDRKILLSTKTRAENMVKENIVCNGFGQICFINRHLLVPNKKKFKYSTETWEYYILGALFPRAFSTNIPTEIPHWVLRKLSVLKNAKKPIIRKQVIQYS